MKRREIRVTSRVETTAVADAGNGFRRFRCHGCSEDGAPVEDFDIVFKSSKPPELLLLTVKS
jgi:hypothetical protein